MTTRDFTSAAVRALRRIHAGKEARGSSGVAVPPNQYIIGNMGATLQQQLYRPDQLETGRLAQYERSEVLTRQAQLQFQTDLNYGNSAVFLLEMAIGDEDATGAGMGYVPFYGPGTSSSRDVDTELRAIREGPATYTIHYGDDRLGWESTFVSCGQLEFSGQVGNVVQAQAQMFGRDMQSLSTPSAMTETARTLNEFLGDTGVTRPNLEDLESVKMNTGRLYLVHGEGNILTDNAALVGVADNEYSQTLVDFGYRITTGFSPMRYASGDVYYSDIAQAKRSVQLTCTCAVTSRVADLYRDAFRVDRGMGAQRVAVTQQPKVQACLEFQGSEADRKVRLGLWGALTEYGELAEREGQDIVRLQFISEYIDGPNKDMQVEVLD